MTLKIDRDGASYWSLYVNEYRAEPFEDQREAASPAARERTGFQERDASGHACPQDIAQWERI
ncbi:hypothetical protein ILP92_15995 [Maribius pontilimi]|uniref:Uncharacterized protein n=1 Tax=Palleronia pontilimi TaxID=1964209 RepID=A0A934MF88_9RHOB|nr:hypothetical protein [Palleronia pontilimi]MBJ3764251.1 hypothetical protein [Palleronia pontilimi]